MRKISLIVIHCSATRVDRDFTAKDVDTAIAFGAFRVGGIIIYPQVGTDRTDEG